MPRQLAQQLMTLTDLKWPFHASRAISAIAELLVQLVQIIGPDNCSRRSGGWTQYAWPQLNVT